MYFLFIKVKLQFNLQYVGGNKVTDLSELQTRLGQERKNDSGLVSDQKTRVTCPVRSGHNGPEILSSAFPVNVRGETRHHHSRFVLVDDYFMEVLAQNL